MEKQTNVRKNYLIIYLYLALEFYQTKQNNKINILTKKALDDLNNFSRENQANIKNNISTLNNFHKVKYEDIKYSSIKDEKMNYINNYNSNYFINKNMYTINDNNNNNKYINIKKNLINTAKNNMNINNNNNNNKINNYNSPKLIHKQNKANHFNKTFKYNNGNNNNFGFNKNNIFLKYYSNEQCQREANLINVKDKSDNNDKEQEIIRSIIKRDLFSDKLNDEYQNNCSIKSDEDEEPDPRINFEQINKINKSRPMTSYGGLNARRKNLQSALQKNKNRPTTSYNINN